jgi:Protein of unknown function (DUF2917)
MLMSLVNMEIQLTEASVLAFRDARDTYLECTEGIVWLTVEGQPGDYLLTKGKRLHIESNNLALIQSLPSASVRLLSIVSGSIRQEKRFAGISIYPQYLYLNT